MDNSCSSSTEPETLTDAQVAATLQRPSVGKLELVLLGDSIYKRGGDGTWLKLS